jgi:hypothetical protein
MKEKIAMWFAYKLPKRIVYWAAIRMAAYASSGRYSTTIVPHLTVMDALERWEKGMIHEI